MKASDTNYYLVGQTSSPIILHVPDAESLKQAQEKFRFEANNICPLQTTDQLKGIDLNSGVFYMLNSQSGISQEKTPINPFKARHIEDVVRKNTVAVKKATKKADRKAAYENSILTPS